MFGWDQWKKGFDRWEDKTATRLERVLRSPKLLTPAGKLLTGAMRVKAARDAALEAWLALWRMPTRGDQERTLHLLNTLQSQLFDLQERLDDLEAKKAKE